MSNVKKNDSKETVLIKKSEFGMVALFDVLGYKSLMENAEIDYVANEILSLFNEMQNMVHSDIISLGTDSDVKSLIQEFLKNVKWLIFSDTILISLRNFSHHSSIVWVFFLTICNSLQSKMFANGLPLRGAIAYGPYIISEKCFAGKAIVDAYNLAESTDWSGCVLHASAEQELERIKVELDKDNSLEIREVLFETNVQKYFVPLKSGKIDNRYCINWPKLYLKIEKTNIRKSIITSFQKHKKHIFPQVHSKILNTEMFMTLCYDQKFKNIK